MSSRRRFVSVAAVATLTGFAGCATDGGDGNGDDNGDAGDDGGDGLSGEDYSAVDNWLTETEVGGAAGGYDGTIVDSRGDDTVTVATGAEGNDGSFAFDPVAVAVTPETTVEWEWTGEGNLHNVVAAPDDQIGESDFEFNSGDPVGGEGVQFTQTFEETGSALYHCVPHLTQGMKGAVVVAEEE